MRERFGTTVLIALGFVLGGFVFLALAWDGAASIDFVQGQIPYLLSGGAVGLGLIILGAALLLFESGRRVTQRLEERLDRLTEALASGGLAAANGKASPSEPAAAPSPDAVVVGAASFHRQGCRLVEGKNDLSFASVDEAKDQGLKACRVCDPLTPDGPATRARRAPKKKS